MKTIEKIHGLSRFSLAYTHLRCTSRLKKPTVHQEREIPIWRWPNERENPFEWVSVYVDLYCTHMKWIIARDSGVRCRELSQDNETEWLDWDSGHWEFDQSRQSRIPRDQLRSEEVGIFSAGSTNEQSCSRQGKNYLQRRIAVCVFHPRYFESRNGRTMLILWTFIITGRYLLTHSPRNLDDPTYKIDFNLW